MNTILVIYTFQFFFFLSVSPFMFNTHTQKKILKRTKTLICHTYINYRKLFARYHTKQNSYDIGAIIIYYALYIYGIQKITSKPNLIKYKQKYRKNRRTPKGRKKKRKTKINLSKTPFLNL